MHVCQLPLTLLLSHHNDILGRGDIVAGPHVDKIDNLEEIDKRLSISNEQACLRPRERFWDIPVPKIDSAFDNLFVPQPSWSPSTTQQLRKLVAAPYLAPNDWTPRSEAYFVFPLAQGTPGKQCGLAATGVYQPSLRSPWLAAIVSATHGGYPL
ncbi:hypothetical protein [Thiolapillus sp.]|uniref:hypothetical protein n=1 Tax=Thiolapillus sp. TaxID=2017437 RepID=UPI0025CDBF10|nr:hypothetical protein [Thiolapillus sp.]